MGLLFIILTVITAIDLLLGGVMAQRNVWRWIFYMNIPIGGLCMVIISVFFRASYCKETFVERLRCIDYFGTGILVA
jgi:MFS family permease